MNKCDRQYSLRVTLRIMNQKEEEERSQSQTFVGHIYIHMCIYICIYINMYICIHR